MAAAADNHAAPEGVIPVGEGRAVDERDIERFVQEDYRRVVNGVALVVGDLDLAEDLVQEALARAWARSRGPQIDSLSSWTMAVALNLARSRLRRLLVQRRHAAELVPLEASDAPLPEALDVERALASLPRRQREVAVLRYLLDMTTAETAAALRVSEGTVKNSLSKARTALAAALRVHDEEEDPDVSGRR
jgi:RNA polymerase sigma-70 factor (ECF subfamily)